MTISVGSGLCPDFHHIVSLGDLHSGQLQLHIAVAVAGVGDFKDIGALLQLCHSRSTLTDSGDPALSIGSGGCIEIKGQVFHLLPSLLGNGQRGISLGDCTRLIGDGIGQLIAASGGRGGLAVLEVQGGHGFHGNLGADVPVFFIGGGDARKGIKFGARFGEQILDTIDDRGDVLFLGSAGCQRRSQGKNKQNRNPFFHILSPVYFA